MRTSAIVRVLYGVSLLVAPHVAIRIVTGEAGSRTTTIVGQVLGVRHLVQALTVVQANTRGWLLVGMVIDIFHALSMVTVAARSPNHRRLAVLDAVVASSWALTEVWAVRKN